MAESVATRASHNQKEIAIGGPEVLSQKDIVDLVFHGTILVIVNSYVQSFENDSQVQKCTNYAVVCSSKSLQGIR